MLVFRCRLVKLKSREPSFSFKRPLLATVFGKKGEPNFTVSDGKENYCVSVISYVTTHGRWNIEKARNHYYVEARRYSKWFFNLDNNESEPEHSKDYRRETKFSRSILHITPEEETTDKRILLIYPRPRLLTYTQTRLEYISSGDVVLGYTVMYADDFFQLFKND
jgi:hypothetical protein